jgi:hypothetical protein
MKAMMLLMMMMVVVVITAVIGIKCIDYNIVFIQSGAKVMHHMEI